MRTYLYIIAGITSALIGWNVAQFIITDLGLLKQFPDIILFPCVAISIAIGIVLTEIFTSNPTRIQRSMIIAWTPISIAIGLGLVAGLIAGSIIQIIYLPQIYIDPRIVRIIAWLVIGIFTGITEGVTWRWRSIEAGDVKRFYQRFQASLVGGIAASLAAALLFEMLLKFVPVFPRYLRGIEEPIGFSILGLVIGFVFSFSTSPSYMVALRAGTGFEYTGDMELPDNNQLPRPIINKKKLSPNNKKSPQLKFVSEGTQEIIEEGLSIQLPATGQILIGDGDGSHIRLPGIPTHIANLELNPRETKLLPNRDHFKKVAVNGERLRERKTIVLKHNYVLTFYFIDENSNDEEKFYRFVYYNRFFDPQA